MRPRLTFAGLTLLTLLLTVGVYRWARILTGQSESPRLRKHHHIDSIQP